MHRYQLQTQLYKVLAHPTRLAILDILREGEQCVCHMETSLDLRQAHISQHLMVLRDAGLVTDRRDGWNIFYRVVQPEIFRVVDAMNTFSGAESEPFHAAHRAAKSSESRKHCSCPKCSPDFEDLAPETHPELLKNTS
jgi:ArsR family transcriptional regulator